MGMCKYGARTVLGFKQNWLWWHKIALPTCKKIDMNFPQAFFATSVRPMLWTSTQIKITSLFTLKRIIFFNHQWKVYCSHSGLEFLFFFINFVLVCFIIKGANGEIINSSYGLQEQNSRNHHHLIHIFIKLFQENLVKIWTLYLWNIW